MPHRDRVRWTRIVIAVLFATTAWLGKIAITGPPAPRMVVGAELIAAQDAETQLPSDREVRLVVDTDNRTLTVLSGPEVVGIFPVAVGKPATPTPIGEWKIIDKDYNWGGAFGARWLGLNISWGRYGIHGTNQPWTIGSDASLGCMRMHDEDILKFFDLVKVGTPVDITGSPHKTNLWHRTLGAGMNGPDVVYVQLALNRKGFYPYRSDGIFGRLTDLGVRCFQSLEGLPVTGRVDKKTDQLLLEEDRAQPEGSFFN